MLNVAQDKIKFLRLALAQEHGVRLFYEEGFWLLEEQARRLKLRHKWRHTHTPTHPDRIQCRTDAYLRSLPDFHPLGRWVVKVPIAGPKGFLP